MNTLAFGIIHCGGLDAEKFLQGQLSANIAALTESQGTLSCYLNLKGRIVALMYVIKRPDGYWLVLPRDVLPTLMQKLKKFIVFSKASLTDVSATYHIEGLLGGVSTLPPYHVTLQGDAVLLCLSPNAGLSLRISPSEHDIAPLPHDFIKAMMHAGIPWIGMEQTEQFLPHYINVVSLGAIAFDKGCFVGQEVVARMHYRGHLNKTLHVIELPAGGDIEIDGDVVNRFEADEKVYLLVSRAS